MREIAHAQKRNPLSDLDEILYDGRHPRRNHVGNVCWRSVKGFRCGGGSNFGISHWLWSSSLQHSRTTVRVCDKSSSRSVRIRKVLHSHSNLHGHSKSCFHWLGHIRFPSSLPLQLCRYLVTGPPTHSVEGRYCVARRASVVVCCLLSSSVDVCNIPRRNVSNQRAARGGPVVLRPVRATPCFVLFSRYYQLFFTIQRGNIDLCTSSPAIIYHALVIVKCELLYPFQRYDWASKNKSGPHDPNYAPFWGWFVICRLVFAAVNLHTNLEVSTSSKI